MDATPHPEAELHLQLPIAPPAVNPHRGWWKLPLMAFATVMLLWIGIDQQARLQARSTEGLRGPIVAFDFSPEGAARAKLLLARQGLKLVESEEGIHAVPINQTPERTLPVATPDLPLPPRPARPMLAIIIDDVGVVPDRSARAVALPAGFTLAFLPYADNLQPLVNRARTNGHEIMLHLPMEGRESADPGRQAMLTGLTAAERRRRLMWNLARFRGYVGVNNHMGSRFTEDSPGMRLVLAELKRRNLFYIDSRTTGASAARQAAADLSVPYAERDVFLDNAQDSAHISIQLAEAESRARAYGTAVAIGHPHDATIQTLAVWQKGLAARGIDLVPASQIITARQTPWWRLAILKQPQTGG